MRGERWEKERRVREGRGTEEIEMRRGEERVAFIIS